MKSWVVPAATAKEREEEREERYYCYLRQTTLQTNIHISAVHASRVDQPIQPDCQWREDLDRERVLVFKNGERKLDGLGGSMGQGIAIITEDSTVRRCRDLQLQLLAACMLVL